MKIIVILRALIGILGIISLGVIFPFALSSPFLEVTWPMYPLGAILALNIMIVLEPLQR